MSILVVGAIHHDVIVDAPSLPRVDETLPGSSVRYAFGGKGGNQALAAGRLGKKFGLSVAMAACIGTDAPGDNALDILRDADVSIEHIQRVETPTGMSVAISLPDGSYGAVIVSGSNVQLDECALNILPTVQMLVLQNELPPSINQAVAARAKGIGVRILLNAAPARSLSPELIDCLDILVVNRVEAADLLGVGVETLDGKATALQLAAQYGCAVVVTLGEKGLWLIDLNGAEFLPAYQVPVISSHGAGDAFVGALSVRLCQGDALKEASSYATAAAALHVSTLPDQRAEITHRAIQALIQTSKR